MTWKRYLSSPFFLIVLGCFFLPFFFVTCSGLGGGLGGFPGAEEAEEQTTFTGFEIVTGKAEDELADPSTLQPDLGPLAGPTPGPSPIIPGLPGAGGSTGAVDLGTAQIWAIAAAAVALLGIFLSLLAGRAGGVVALGLGAAGAVLLFLLASEFKNSILDAAGGEQAEGILEVQKKIGYTLALLAFILAGVTGLVRLLLPDRPATAAGAEPGFGEPGAAPPPSPTGAPPPPPPPEAPPQ